jgi:DNA ligase (NAD+)
LKEQDLIKLLTEAKEAYYNTDTALLSDAEFDRLEDELRVLNPQSSYFSIIGSETGSSGKIIHAEAMLSMGKAKSPQEVFKWLDKLALPPSTKWTMQPKIDGLSASCYYKNGKLQYVATRGDGTIGQDVTSISNYIKTDIPKTIPEKEHDIEIRGELYLPKNTAYDTGGRPLRNNCVGLVNRKENREDLKYVRFVCYQSARWNPSESEAGIIDWLTKAGFHTVEYFSIKSRADIESFYNEYLESRRDEWLYETDGLILTVDDNTSHEEIDSRWVVNHHHHYAIAIKPPAAAKKTHLTGVDWQVSRQGALVPVALFEPIQLGGATLARASLHNNAFVESMALQLGDELLIERANDVIPYVKENISSENRDGELFFSTMTPDKCPACGSAVKTEGVHLKCSNPVCPERQIQTILYWVKESGMEQVAEATIRQLHDRKIISNVGDLYRVQTESLVGLEGFAEKKISNFFQQLDKVRRMTAPELISKLGIPLVQQKALKKLGIKSMEEFRDFEDDSYVTGQNIIAWKAKKDNRLFLENLLEVVEMKKVEIVESRGQVCMTGKGSLGRKELQKIIEERGYEFSSSVTKSTSILICEDPEGISSKLQKARKNGIQLISYEDFLNQ